MGYSKIIKPQVGKPPGIYIPQELKAPPVISIPESEVKELVEQILDDPWEEKPVPETPTKKLRKPRPSKSEPV
jgi:hypothetical protein